MVSTGVAQLVRRRTVHVEAWSKAAGSKLARDPDYRPWDSKILT